MKTIECVESLHFYCLNQVKRRDGGEEGLDDWYTQVRRSESENPSLWPCAFFRCQGSLPTLLELEAISWMEWDVAS